MQREDPSFGTDPPAAFRRPLLLVTLDLRPTVAIRKASANPTVVARPATAPPYLYASGIIVSASIVMYSRRPRTPADHPRPSPREPHRGPRTRASTRVR